MVGSRTRLASGGGKPVASLCFQERGESMRRIALAVALALATAVVAAGSAWAADVEVVV
jgi:hypothetical protein